MWLCRYGMRKINNPIIVKFKDTARSVKLINVILLVTTVELLVEDHMLV